MKISIIGTVGVPANYGGFETLVEQLIVGKHNPQLEYTVYCSASAYPDKLDNYKGASLKYVGLKANGMQSIPYDIISLIKATRSSDAILMLGVSGCLFLPIYRLFSKKQLVINIDGLEHRRDKWKPWVRAILKGSEKMAVKYGDIIVSDNKGIQDYVMEEYSKSSELIAYGGDQALQSVGEAEQKDVLLKYCVEDKEYAMGLCRIEPENNVHVILEAFSKLPERHLIFFGNWGKSEYGRELKEKYSRYPNISLFDAEYDSKVINTLRNNSAMYFHGHSAGGTNPSLVEAMFADSPIFAFDCVYNRETTEGKAIYFANTEDLIRKLQVVKHEELQQCKADMREIAERRYRWDVVAQQYENLLLQ